VNLQDIEQKALGLSERERVKLVLQSRNTLSASETDMSDEEVLRRDVEWEAGKSEPMLHEKLVRQVRADRGR